MLLRTDGAGRFSRLNRAVLLLLVAGVFLAGSRSPARPQAVRDRLSLESLLKRCADYCERLSRASLNFVCREKIEETVYFGLRRADSKRAYWNAFRRSWALRNNYVYDYQLFQKAGFLEESRTLLEENGEARNEKNAALKTDCFDHKYVVLGPIGLLATNWQARNEFRILDRRKIGRDEAVVIEVRPRGEALPGHLYGRVWVRAADAGILRIEWAPESLGNYAQMLASAGERAVPEVSFVSEYGLEKNGVRFPSRYRIAEAYRNRRGENIFPQSETVVVYEAYKFFTVETEVRY
ncbi:MAG: hypothetical protein OEW05_03930 [Candidatus Aminicenantes bacterium]|nr:hypothetical protein [Candidatus Aminicenantes bacterium]